MYTSYLSHKKLENIPFVDFIGLLLYNLIGIIMKNL